MEPSDFAATQRQHLIHAPQDYWAFVPPPLAPDLTLDMELASGLSEADRAIGELGGVGGWLPHVHLLSRPFIRREAVLSSRIEGTAATVGDLLLFEVDPYTTTNDVVEVHNYTRALELATDPHRDLPLSLRLLRDMHRVLLTGVRGGYATPGEFRRSQNWIGPANCVLNDATFVPPPVDEMTEALGTLERHLHDPVRIPPLLRIAMIHYQFEAIHPFVDGNGRVGRLLISLLLQEWSLLSHPLLYLSAYFEARRSEYYDCLLGVSRNGDWRSWYLFFLAGVANESADVVQRAANLSRLREEYHSRVQVTRASALLTKLIDRLFEHPAIRIGDAKSLLNISYRAASQNIAKLEAAAILHEATGRQRNRIYVANEIVDLLV